MINLEALNSWTQNITMCIGDLLYCITQNSGGEKLGETNITHQNFTKSNSRFTEC